jgi:hypothetical protein
MIGRYTIGKPCFYDRYLCEILYKSLLNSESLMSKLAPFESNQLCMKWKTMGDSTPIETLCCYVIVVIKLK